MKTILVTGAQGQLGTAIRELHGDYPEFRFLFTDRKTLDITDPENIGHFFQRHKPDYCINCAAYTHVEQAEKEPEKAFRINAEAVHYLANSCKEYGTTLLHLSTDYVFDGTKRSPYTEDDIPNPINQYGSSKLKGEQIISSVLHHYFIVRTSWLYNTQGKNFYTTILKKAETAQTLYVTDRETGCPTNAGDLAAFLMRIIASGYTKYGTYHYCGGNSMTWYDFAMAILRENAKQELAEVVRTKNYHTFAKRPVYSVLQPSTLHIQP